MNGQEPILSVFAFTMIDEDGTEGVPAFPMPNGSWMPMMGADLARVESLRPIAATLAKQLDRPITLVHFSQRTVQEVIHPDGTVDKDLYDVAKHVTEEAGYTYHDPRGPH